MNSATSNWVVGILLLLLLLAVAAVAVILATSNWVVGILPILLLLLLAVAAVAVILSRRLPIRPAGMAETPARIHARRGLALAALGIGIALAARLLGVQNPLVVQYIPLAMGVLGVVSALRAFLGGAALDEQSPSATSPPTSSPHASDGEIPAETVSIAKGIGDLRFSGAGRTIRGGDLRLGIGDLEVDLVGVRLPAGTHMLRAHVGMGDLRIRAPLDVPTRIEAAVGVGEIRIGSQRDSGFRNRLVQEDPRYADAASRLTIAASVGVGEIRVP